MPPDRDPALHEVKPEEHWYTEPTGPPESSHGAVRIKKAHNHGTNNRLPVPMRAALALTEFCCARGKGKVYFFVSHPNILNQDEKHRFDANKDFHEVAEVFYVPEVWTKKTQRWYKEAPPKVRVEFLASRNGWVTKRTPILPFNIQIDDPPFDSLPKLNGLGNALLTIWVTKVPIVGSTEKLRKSCASGRLWNVTRRDTAPLETYYKGADRSVWANFDWARVYRMQGILKELDAAFKSGMVDGNNCLCFYGDLTRAFILAARTAADKGQPYGQMGDLDGDIRFDDEDGEDDGEENDDDVDNEDNGGNEAES